MAYRLYLPNSETSPKAGEFTCAVSGLAATTYLPENGSPPSFPRRRIFPPARLRHRGGRSVVRHGPVRRPTISREMAGPCMAESRTTRKSNTSGARYPFQRPASHLQDVGYPKCNNDAHRSTIENSAAQAAQIHWEVCGCSRRQVRLLESSLTHVPASE